MTITDIITYLQNHLDETDIILNSGASAESIKQVEVAYNIIIPDDIKQFYAFSNGFLSEEDQFRIVPLDELIKNKIHGEDKFYIAEYLCYCDMWELVVDDKDHNSYKIISNDGYRKWVLTPSLAEFISRFLNGGVFESGGLYDWNNELTVEWIGGHPFTVSARFLLESIFLITNRSFVITGQLAEGTITTGNIIFAMDGIKPTAINISDVEYGHNHNGGLIGLQLGTYISEGIVLEFKKLIGTTISIYRFHYDTLPIQ